MRKRPRLLSGLVIALSALVLPVPALARAPSEAAQVRAQLAGVRLPFIANEGQVDAQVAYYAPTFAGTLFVTQRGELVYALSGPRTDAPRERGRPSSKPGWSLTETLLGGRARPVAQERRTTGVSVFLGNDPARWRAALPTSEQVSLGEVWPGVTVALRARGRSMEKVFTVHPGGAVARIRCAWPVRTPSRWTPTERWWRARGSGPSRSPRPSPIKSATACAVPSPLRIVMRGSSTASA
jgi:hypothetical protein